MKCRWNFFTLELETSFRFFSFSADDAAVAADEMDRSFLAVMLLVLLALLRKGLMLRSRLELSTGFKELELCLRDLKIKKI